MIADDDEGRLGHAPDPVAGRLEFVRQSLLGHIAGDQDQVAGRRVGEVEGGGAGVAVFAAEMHVGELKHSPH